MGLFSRKPALCQWKEATKDQLVQELADVACAPEKFKTVVVLAVEADGQFFVSRYRAQDTSTMETLGLLDAAKRFYLRRDGVAD